MDALLLCCAVVALASRGSASSAPGYERPTTEATHRRHDRAADDWLGASVRDDSVDTLELGSQGIQRVPRAAFRNTPNVYSIDLNNNSISEVDVGAFEGVPQLSVLYLHNNDISRLPEALLTPVPQLGYLSLSGNRIEELTPKHFAGLTTLESMWVQNNKVELKLCNRTFANLSNLWDIGLSRSNIRTLPRDVFTDSNRLEYIYLSDNKIEELDNLIFYGLNKLRELYLCGNRIKTLQPALFFGVPNLEKLCLSNNSLIISTTQNVFPPTDEYLINQLDEEFKTDGGPYSPFQNLRHLKYLKLDNNSISVICTDWRTFPSLKRLELSHNNIPNLSEKDMHFRSNPVVDLQYNRIQRFDPFVYSSGRSVPTFILDHNPYHCSCPMLPFVQKYSRRGASNLPILYVDGATCAEPTHLRGKRLSELTVASLGSCSTSDTSAPELQIFPNGSRFSYTPDVWTSLTCRGSNLPNSSSVCLMQYIDGEEIYRNCFLPLPSVHFFFSPSVEDDNSNMFCIAEHYVNKDYSRALRLAQSTRVTLHLAST